VRGGRRKPGGRPGPPGPRISRAVLPAAGDPARPRGGARRMGRRRRARDRCENGGRIARRGGRPMTRVDKPWGYELRFARTAGYAGKVLFIRGGSQLSLQYHELKAETFFVQSGTLELVVGRGADQRVEPLGPGESRRITPGTVHRFRAVTDCLLFEVSTPE